MFVVFSWAVFLRACVEVSTSRSD